MNSTKLLQAAIAALSWVSVVSARGDAVTDWNAHLDEAVFATAQPVPAQPRSAAIMHLAIFDAVNGIDRRYTPYFVRECAPPGARAEAAAQVKEARIWGGIHFRHACDVGQPLGETLAEYACDHFLTELRGH